MQSAAEGAIPAEEAIGDVAPEEVQNVPEGAIPAEEIIGEVTPEEVQQSAIQQPVEAEAPQQAAEPKRTAPLTPADEASPLPNDKISRGKAIIEDAAAGRPLDIEPAVPKDAAPVTEQSGAIEQSAAPKREFRKVYASPPRAAPAAPRTPRGAIAGAPFAPPASAPVIRREAPVSLDSLADTRPEPVQSDGAERGFTPAPEQIPAPAPAPERVSKPALEISDYSDNSILITGQTKENIGRIKGAISTRPLWNRKAKGWIFPKAREADVREALADLLEAGSSPETRLPDPKIENRTEQSAGPH